MAYYGYGYKRGNQSVQILGVKMKPNGLLRKFKREVATDTNEYILVLVVSEDIVNRDKKEDGMFATIVRTHRESKHARIWNVNRPTEGDTFDFAFEEITYLASEENTNDL
jgi:hypothetical protein